MLSWRQRKAIRLMFTKPDEEVAALVGVRLETMDRWKHEAEFRHVLFEEEKFIRQNASRISAEASLIAAKTLHKLMGEAKDAKLCIDMLKASNSFNTVEVGEEYSLDNIIRVVSKNATFD